MSRLQTLVARTFDKVQSAPDRETSARSIARSTTIVGLMLEGISERRGGWTSFGGSVSRIGRVLWSLVELAAPQSLLRILGQHWIALFYALGILMIAVGFIGSQQDIALAGAKVVGLTALVNFFIFGLNRWMRKLSRRIIWLVFALSLLSTAGVLAYDRFVLDPQIVQNGGQDFASAKLGTALTPSAAAALLGRGNDGKIPKASLQAARQMVQIDSLLILSYTVLLLTLGLLLHEFRLFAGIALVLAISDVLENEQTLRVLDLSTTPVFWWGKLLFTVVAVLATIGLLVMRLRSRQPARTP